MSSCSIIATLAHLLKRIPLHFIAFPSSRMVLFFCLISSPILAQSLDEDLRQREPKVLAELARSEGDAIRGAVIFFQHYLACSKCHSVGNNAPSALGPDLAKLGKEVSDESLVESVLLPSKVIRKGFESVTVVMADGTSRAGFLIEKTTALTELRMELLSDNYFSGVESFCPGRKKTSLQFHAKDDLPEVRFLIFRLLRSFGKALRFHAVVCDKLELLKQELVKRQAEPNHRFKEGSIYDDLMRSLFAKFHRLADRYELCVAKRGNRERNHAIQSALERAEDEFEVKFGFRRAPKSWEIKVSNPKLTVCLQAVDYFLWTVQRFYEVKRDAVKQAPIIVRKTQSPIREDRFLRMLWPQMGEIHDLHFGPNQGTFFTGRHPLTLDVRFPVAIEKKKKP